MPSIFLHFAGDSTITSDNFMTILRDIFVSLLCYTKLCLYTFLLLVPFKTFIIFLKSKKGIKKWTFLKMSKFENPNKVSKNSVFSHCDQDAHNYYFV